MERMTSTVEEIKEVEKETKIKKIKNWVKDHKEDIISFGLMTVGVIGICTVGIRIKQEYVKTSNEMKDFALKVAEKIDDGNVSLCKMGRSRNTANQMYRAAVNFEDITSINDIQKTISNIAEAIDPNAILKVTNCVLGLEFEEINKRD